MKTSSWPVRIGLALAVTVYLVYSSFGIAHPCLWGHMGHHEAEYMMRVRTTFRQHMVTPATHAGYDVPPWNDYYLHHPIGYHHLLALWTLIVGDHIWTPTTFPALTGLLLIWALYTLVKRWWSREWAVVAVWLWVTLPIICSFSILTDAMFPSMACSILFCYAYLEYTEEPSGRWLKIALLTQIVFGLLFWEAYFQALFHGIMITVWGRTRYGRGRKLGRWPAWLAWLLATGTLSSATMAFHLVFTWAKGMWGDFLISFHQRHSAGWKWIYDRHKMWLHILYGWPLVALGFLWILVFIVRCLNGKARKRDQAVLIFFAINSIYIYLFAEGSAMHLYRVFWFSSFLVLAVMDLLSDLYGLISKVFTRQQQVALIATAAALGVYFAVDLPHAYANLLESRVMMGTHGEPNYNADYPKQLFAMEVARRTGPKDLVLVHRNLPHRVEFWYYVDRTNRLIGSVGQIGAFAKINPRPVVLMDGYNVGPGERQLIYGLLARHPGYLFDRYLMIDTRSDHPEFREYRFRPLKPSPAYRWFVSHRYPPMATVPTATLYSACVYAATGVKPPADLPEVTPPFLSREDQVICWHAYQLLRGRTDRANALAARFFSTARPLDVALPFAHAIAFKALSRRGLEVWFRMESQAPRRPLHFTLTPVGQNGQPGKPILAAAYDIGQQTLDQSRPGELYGARLAFAAAPGHYRIALDLGPPYTPVPLGEADLR